MDDMYESQNEPMPDEAAPDEKMDMGKEELINKDICPDGKPGDVIMLKIMTEHESEFGVSYMGKKGEGEGDDAGKEPMPEMAGGGDSLMD
jgi:hypothetical protein